jgi:hypothetical protein
MDEEKQLEVLKGRACILVEEQEMYRRAIEVSVSAIRELEKVAVADNKRNLLLNLIEVSTVHLTKSINTVNEKLKQA